MFVAVAAAVYHKPAAHETLGLDMMFPRARVLCVPFQADVIRGARLT